jgi:hypothetical protein
VILDDPVIASDLGLQALAETQVFLRALLSLLAYGRNQPLRAYKLVVSLLISPNV